MYSSKQIFTSSCELQNICHDVILENVGSSDTYVMDSKVGIWEEHHIHYLSQNIFASHFLTLLWYLNMLFTAWQGIFSISFIVVEKEMS